MRQINLLLNFTRENVFVFLSVFPFLWRKYCRKCRLTFVKEKKISCLIDIISEIDNIIDWHYQIVSVNCRQRKTSFVRFYILNPVFFLPSDASEDVWKMTGVISECEIDAKSDPGCRWERLMLGMKTCWRRPHSCGWHSSDSQELPGTDHWTSAG